METIEVRTDVYRPAEAVYSFLLDPSRLASYSKHVQRVTVVGGDGGDVDDEDGANDTDRADGGDGPDGSDRPGNAEVRDDVGRPDDAAVRNGADGAFAADDTRREDLPSESSVGDGSRVHGDSIVGTRYRFHVAWWKLATTVDARVTAADRPRRIDWELVDGPAARGSWEIVPHDEREAGDSPGGPSGAGDEESGVADASVVEVRFRVRFDPASVTTGTVGLPRFVPVERVVERGLPIVLEEAERVVRRAVAELEGTERAVELRITEPPTSDSWDRS